MVDEGGVWLGQYELHDVIRRGPLATIYKALQPSLERFVAIKVLHQVKDPASVTRFQLEARSIARLQHPNILPVYDYGEQDGHLYLVAQYIEGGTTLAHQLGEPMAPSDAFNMASRVLDALDHAHTLGVIHRDVKPANVLITPQGWPLLADFGIAKLIAQDDPGLTQTGFVVGTAAYIAPEQALGQAVDARTDVYALGVVLYEMLTGQVPFVADTPMAALARHAYEPPPPPRSLVPDLPEPVEEVLLRSLAKAPDDRYQSAGEMRAALEALSEGLRPRAPVPVDVSDLTGTYVSAVEAFGDAKWDLAIARLNRVMSVDPDYEDAPELLEAAQMAWTEEQASTGPVATLPPPTVEELPAAEPDPDPFPSLTNRSQPTAPPQRQPVESRSPTTDPTGRTPVAPSQPSIPPAPPPSPAEQPTEIRTPTGRTPTAPPRQEPTRPSPRQEPSRPSPAEQPTEIRTPTGKTPTAPPRQEPQRPSPQRREPSSPATPTPSRPASPPPSAMPTVPFMRPSIPASSPSPSTPSTQQPAAASATSAAAAETTVAIDPVARHPSGPLPVLPHREREREAREAKAKPRQHSGQTSTLARPLLIGAGGAAVVVAVVAAILALLSSGGSNDATQSNAASTLTVPQPGVQDLGRIRFSDGDRPLDTVTLIATGITPAPEGQQYQAWLVDRRTTDRRPLGTITPDADGSATLEVRGGAGSDLVGAFDSIEVTLEPNPDPDARPQPNSVVAQGSLPAGALDPIRNLLSAFDDAATGASLTGGLRTAAEVARSEATAMYDAKGAGDLAGMRQHAEALANLIIGPEGARYGDVDGNGSPTVVGDGYGLLRNGPNLGYIDGTLAEANRAASATDATENVKTHAGHVAVAAQNMAAWAAQLRDHALTVATAPSLVDAEAAAVEAKTLADLLVDGQDVTGDGLVDAVPEEGGANTAYEHAQYMADILVFPA